ncbi:MAG TPA: short chain dehydrogenase [Myxococcales bacterium]|nr:short chain dehydrogenase [Myxococcales bacterium]HAN30341.1 short chain dehydrogenase [Myxococcales bacterium]
MTTDRSLKGKTLFITGGSRGIGRAIALRAAKDGANVVIAAKTSTPHPTLPGTIHSVAEEIIAAGGQALPVVVDVREESQVEAATQAAVQRFGGIDICVNNASAIELLPTLDLSMKRFDLMHQVNTRGTYLTSRACLPHLLKSDNPHILNLSPPLNLNPNWFKYHLGYTMAKYGMSMCVVGLSAEFAGQVTVNGLWPRTLISTSAVRMFGGDDLLAYGRTPQIMADAAHVVLTTPAGGPSGQFLIDDEVLASQGITDLSAYATKPGNELMPDLFLDPHPDDV